MVKDLIVYHDGFTRSTYEKGTVQSFEEGFALVQIERGYCVETKPLIFADKETKPLVRKRAVKGYNSSSD